MVGLFALSTNVLLGYTGLLSFGQSAFFGLGAYIVAFILKEGIASIFLAMVISTGVCAITALLIGIFCIHLRAFYFAILTLSVSQFFYAIAYKWVKYTGGDDGIVGIPKTDFLGLSLEGTVNYYYFLIIIVLVCFAAIYLILHSPFGEVLQSIRENPERAAFSGINVKNYRLGSFFVASIFAGIAGALYAPSQGIITPNVLHWSKSSEPLLVSLLGGMQTFAGPLAGSVIFVVIKEWITQYTEYWMFWYGLLMVLMIIYMPGGIVGSTQRIVNFMMRGK